MRRWMLIAVACCLTTGCAEWRTATPAATRKQAHERWDRVRAELKLQLARQHFEGRRFRDAERVATEALSFDPSLAAGYVLLAKAHLEQGEPMSAARAVEAARHGGLDSAELTYMEGVVLEQRGDLDGASAAFARSCALDATNVDYLLAHAESLVAVGRPEEAMTRLDAAEERYDDEASVMLLAAHVATLLGDTRGAIDRYRKALQADGDNRVAARELGLLLASTGRHESATVWLARALNDDEDPDRSLRLPLAESYLQSHRQFEAREVLRPLLRGGSLDPDILATCTKAALALHDFADALELTERGLALVPNDARLTLLRATALWRTAEPHAAERVLLDLRSREPDHVTAICLLAEVMRSTGRRDRAGALFRRALELEPDNLWAKRGLNALKALTRARTRPIEPEATP